MGRYLEVISELEKLQTPAATIFMTAIVFTLRSSLPCSTFPPRKPGFAPMQTSSFPPAKYTLTLPEAIDPDRRVHIKVFKSSVQMAAYSTPLLPKHINGIFDVLGEVDPRFALHTPPEMRSLVVDQHFIDTIRITNINTHIHISDARVSLMKQRAAEFRKYMQKQPNVVSTYFTANIHDVRCPDDHEVRVKFTSMVNVYRQRCTRHIEFITDWIERIFSGFEAAMHASSDLTVPPRVVARLETTRRRLEILRPRGGCMDSPGQFGHPPSKVQKVKRPSPSGVATNPCTWE